MSPRHLREGSQSGLGRKGVRPGRSNTRPGFRRAGLGICNVKKKARRLPTGTENARLLKRRAVGGEGRGRGPQESVSFFRVLNQSNTAVR